MMSIKSDIEIFPRTKSRIISTDFALGSNSSNMLLPMAFAIDSKAERVGNLTPIKVRFSLSISISEYFINFNIVWNNVRFRISFP